MKLSQGNLTVLETCPRLFQHQVLEQLGVPQLGEVWERLQLGSQFHQLMQQRSQDLPIESIVAADPDLSCWFRAVEDYGDELFPRAEDPTVWTDSEHVRTLEWMGHTVVGIYDYVVLAPQSAQILDWKTYPKPIETRHIQQAWQSRLYPFLLAETSDYQPEQIEMRYWFFQGTASQNPSRNPSQPQMLRLPYDRTQRDQTAQDLTALLTRFNQWWGAYEKLETPFPKTELRSTCETCAFAVRCDRAVGAVEEWGGMRSALVWDEVGEVAIGLVE
jgi:PD-(D/E)XK nuclease superfamily